MPQPTAIAAASRFCPRVGNRPYLRPRRQARPTAPSTKDFARSYGRAGWKVLPLYETTVSGACACSNTNCTNTGKHPRTQHGWKDASRDDAQIDRWWKTSPDANVGIATGATSRIVVVDVDERNGGLDQLMALCGGVLPYTLTAITGNGYHLYFRYPAGVGSFPRRLAPGLDVQGDGKYVCAPPSRHHTGVLYQWEDPSVPIADAPPWLLAFLKPPGAPSSAAAQPRPSAAPSQSTFDIPSLVRATLAAAPPSPEWPHVLRGERIAPNGARDNTLTALSLSAVNAIRKIRHSDLDYVKGHDGKERSAVAFARNRVALAEADPATLAPPLFGPALAAANDVSDPGPTIVDAEAKLRSALTKVRRERCIDTVGEERAYLGWLERIEENSKPHIVVGTDVPAVADAVERALARLGRREREHAIYSRGEVLVDVIAESSPDAVGIEHPPNAPRSQVVPSPALIEAMSRAATFSEERHTKKGSYEVDCWPPDKLGKIVEERRRWSLLPRLTGIIETPALVANGRIIDTPGYDVASGLLYIPSTVYPAVPAEPTQADARRAMDELLEPACQMSFASGHTSKTSHDRAALAALILTIVARHAIKAPVPLFSFSSPVPGSGKSFLASMAAIVGLGRRATTTSLVNDEAEMDKRLLAIALSATPLVVFDDLPDGVLGTSALSRALTDYSQEMYGRLLGQNRWVRVPLMTIFVATGNNISYKNTLFRRVVQCSIDPGVETPETRSGWRYPDFLGHVSEHRAHLTVCALTVLRAHYLAGRPQHAFAAQGSFEKWDSIVRSAIIWADCADPCAGREAIRVQADADLEPLRALVAAWHAQFGSQQISIGTAITTAQRAGVTGLWLLNALSAIDDRLRPAQLGQALGRWRDRVVDGMRFEAIFNKSNKVQEWRVVAATPATPSAPPATAAPVAPASAVTP